MSTVPARDRPAFRAAVLAFLLAATWVYDYIESGELPGASYAAVLDLLLLIFLFIACVFVFSQFILPIKTLQDRLRIAGRLWLHAWGVHGPAIFVRNGRKVERRGEAERGGPGLIWVDTASAALTHTDAGPRRVLGPGVHFTEPRERIEKTFSLHAQTSSIGPDQDDAIFERLPDDAGEEALARYEEVQARRREVSGLTRDGNEVVPEIRVTFKLDGMPAPAHQPGSRFGFSAESVERAARGEGLNVDAVTARPVQVAWNQLPGLIAVELWREYLAKFTLDELVTARFAPVPDVLQPEQRPMPDGPEGETRNASPGRGAHLLWRINNRLEKRFDAHGGRERGATAAAAPAGSSTPRRTMRAGREYTGLQVISHMVWARMAQAAVPVLDESARYGKGHFLSEEFKRLQERGLRILDVQLGGYRFARAVEEKIVHQWRSTWLEAAAGDRAHVSQLELLAAEAGRQRALLDHAGVLGSALRADSVTSVATALKAILQATHAEILTDEHLRGRGGAELQSIAAIAKWVDSVSDD